MHKEQAFDQRLLRLRIIACLSVICIHVTHAYLYHDAFVSRNNFPFVLCLNAGSRIAVPLFFMISGYLTLSRPYVPEKNRKRICHFLLVLLLWSLGYYLWNTLFLQQEPLPLLSYFFKPVKNHLWYLYDLIALYIALPFIHTLSTHMSRSTENKFLLLWLLFGGGVRFIRLVCNAYDIETTTQYYIPIIQSTYHLGYFISGYILYKRKEEFHKIPAWVLYAISIVCILAITLCTYVQSIFTNEFQDGFLTYGTIFVMLNSICIFLLNARYRAAYHPAAAWFSSLTFGIYLLHPLFIDLMKKIIDFPHISALWIPVMVIVITLLTTAIIAILSHVPKLRKLIM